jgi:hypothetical protein
MIVDYGRVVVVVVVIEIETKYSSKKKRLLFKVVT